MLALRISSACVPAPGDCAALAVPHASRPLHPSVRPPIHAIPSAPCCARCITILQKVAACQNAGTAAMLLESEDAAVLKRLQAKARQVDANASVSF